jgi:hypothetical protein
MRPAHGVSRSFPLLTLAMAVPLVAILAFVAYDRYVKDDGPGDGWQTYRNERFKFEIRLPPSWRVELEHETSSESRPGVAGIAVRFADPEHPSSFGQALHAEVSIIPGGRDWCTSSAPLIESRDITVGSLKGTENLCFWSAGQPFSVLRDFTKDGNRVWVIGETAPPPLGTSAPEFPTALKIVQSFRFTD